MVRVIYDSEEAELARLRERAIDVKVAAAKKISELALKQNKKLWLEVRGF